jgi:hypothetical protein
MNGERDWQKIYEQYCTGKSMNTISKEMNCNVGNISYWFKKHGFELRKHSDAVKLGQTPLAKEKMSKTWFKKNHCSWSKGKKQDQLNSLSRIKKRKASVNASGYKKVWLHNKKVFEHHLVWCEKNNIGCVPYGYVIHHINENKLDNRPENLVLLDKATHASVHHQLDILKGRDRAYWGINLKKIEVKS